MSTTLNQKATMGMQHLRTCKSSSMKPRLTKAVL